LSTSTLEWKTLKLKAIANITKAISLQQLSMQKTLVVSFKFGAKTLEETLKEMQEETEYGKEQILIWAKGDEEIERERQSLRSKT
jgi:hypothetical protein